VSASKQPMSTDRADVTLDVLGFHCPVPVHETKRTLATMDTGNVLLVMADDPETKMDMPALLNRTGDTLIELHEEAGEFHYRIRKEAIA
jgi:tRNA 2-thiouridine synthesizing protein A